MALTFTERKEKVSELLRTVDREIRSGELSEALRIVGSVIEIDPNNVYARAFSERITELIEERRSVPAAPSIGVPPPAEGKPVREFTLSRAITEAYRCFLTEVWSDGAVTAQELQRIDEMRTLFRISPLQHTAIERDVRHEAFITTVKEHALTGSKRFDQWRAQYRITAEEFAMIMPRINSISQSINDHLFVLVIDDDPRFLQFVKTLLEKKGYNCITVLTCQAAHELLERIFPDIVLCDISLNDPEMDGLMFYEQFRALEKFRLVPFIFITGNANDELVRKAKYLGADDLLEKPVDKEMLLACIEGRLRRINELRLV